MKNLVTIVGNRPQFIKMAPVSRVLKNRGYREIIIHSGQHFDYTMSELFFKELEITKPEYFLNITHQSHGKMTAEILSKLEDIFQKIKPQSVLIYGDTNTTLAAALAAVKLKIRLAHVESGPRIYDIDTPEEINRIVADHASKIRFCPDIPSIQNLAKENITNGVYLTGDVMYDAYIYFTNISEKKSTILRDLGLEPEKFLFLTVHRPNNTDQKEVLENMLFTISKLKYKVVFAVHPRTEKSFKLYNLWDSLKAISNLVITPPLGYLDTLALVNNCKCVLTDSGGLQKEAYFARKKCLVLFYTTPWPQIKDCGWQKVIGCFDVVNSEVISSEIKSFSKDTWHKEIFGNGNAAEIIVDLLEKHNFV
ncbi:UDP-N-acetylglucosamine 2-epimerase (non-hydrolyzing) [Candidatus Megaera polyxenophila]|jgi:UDP-N-acetylglucosamine 2-epimerase|uniref:non-hydrolyzing UDP-N-acetylglucosamine 2-epimerase n=1 Tax=Candidatus Megaera polyxenophila TaxID=988779 RepID=UPI00249E81B5|nr:UDP-N-acetylglucosamine 2-epimerase (non-hydrolyzing) [Candidatus Megaera polyxenophila]